MTGEVRSDDFYQLTGQVIRAWAKLELLLSQWLIDLLDVDELRSRIIWDSYGDFRGKVDLLKILTRNFADERMWIRAKGIFSDVEKIGGNRYILPHAFGDVDEGRKTLSFLSERPDGDWVVDFLQHRSVDTDVLTGWLREIAESQARVAAFKRELPGAVHRESLLHRGAANSPATSV